MDELDAGQTIRGLVAGQRLFGRYILIRIAGRGGMGVVWMARDEKLDRDVALKFLPQLLVHDPALLDQMKRETRRSLELTHHHIVRIHDFADDPPFACISMEYVDGSTLSALRVQQANRVFEVDEVREWIAQACQALHYAHRQARIVHRDLKPANLMLNSKGELKIADFGISRSLTDSVSMLTQSRGTSGTLAYMSPQQLVGERASHFDDIYSLGASIYDLLTGHPPFYSGQIEFQIREKLPPTMRQRRLELGVENAKVIPTEWEECVAACLSKDPRGRPESAGELAARLGLEKATHTNIAAARPEPPPLPVQTRTPRNTTHRRWVLISVIAVLALVVGFTIMKWFVQLQRLKPRTALQTPEPRAIKSPSPAIASFSPTPATALLREPIVTPPSELSPTPQFSISPEATVSAGTPVGAVRLYFDAINRRDLTAAYELTSDEFRRRTTLDQYQKLFANTLRLSVSRISSTAQTGDTARVSVEFHEVNSTGQEMDWSGNIDVAWSQGKWRIDSMKNLVSRKAPPSKDLPAEPSADQHLKKFTNLRYSYTAWVPADLFPTFPQQSSDSQCTFLSPDGRTSLTLAVEVATSSRKLADLYREWSAERTKARPNKVAPYKILKDRWFVVSGDEAGRGFYFKCVSRGQYLISLLLEYDEENCPVSKETFTAMSRGFDGNVNP